MAVALVTGASRGVGKGVATALHDAGYHVFATGRTIETWRSAGLADGTIKRRTAVKLVAILFSIYKRARKLYAKAWSRTLRRA